MAGWKGGGYDEAGGDSADSCGAIGMVVTCLVTVFQIRDMKRRDKESHGHFLATI
jgi:hypothetical protein